VRAGERSIPIRLTRRLVVTERLRVIQRIGSYALSAAFGACEVESINRANILRMGRAT
jgi:hypothetical protein